MRRLSRRFGLRIEAVLLEDGAHAIDVDNARTYRIAETVLRQKQDARLRGPSASGDGDPAPRPFASPNAA
jgi:hypothetical protein